jgi:short-subunit dehydrogenase
LLKDGAVVYVAARRVEKMKALKEQGAYVLQMDVTDEQSIQQGLNEIEKNHQGVNILVNNAGYAVYGPVEHVSIDDARRQFEVNIFGLARLTQLIIPYMRENGYGKIVNISSIGGKVYTPLGAWYHATKHALEGWSDCLRLETKGFGIDVIIIEQGGIKTEFGDVMLDPMIERAKGTVYQDLANRIGKATKETYDQGKASPPEVISKLISKAVKSSNPQTRYSAGYMSGIALFTRKWFPDTWFDKVIMQMG